MLKLKLIAENPDLLERFEIVEEQDNLKKGSSLYVKGPFIGCNQVNKNRLKSEKKKDELYFYYHLNNFFSGVFDVP